MNKERYKEEDEEGSELLWPSEKEDKITRNFYRDLYKLTNTRNLAPKNKRSNFVELLISIINWQR